MFRKRIGFQKSKNREKYLIEFAEIIKFISHVVMPSLPEIKYELSILDSVEIKNLNKYK